MQKTTIVTERATITGASTEPTGALLTLNKNPANPKPPKTAYKAAALESGCVASIVDRLTRTMEAIAISAPMDPVKVSRSPRNNPTLNGMNAATSAVMGATAPIGPSPSDFKTKMYPTIPQVPANRPEITACLLNCAPRNGAAIKSEINPVPTVIGKTLSSGLLRVASPPK